MLQVSPRIRIEEAELQEEFLRASGPGGQNVNKVETAVQLRFDLAHNTSIPEDARARLAAAAGRRLTQDGVLVIQAQRFRTQERNRQDARDRLVEMIRAALTAPKKRRPTRPTLASKERRLEAKSRNSSRKQQRRPSHDD